MPVVHSSASAFSTAGVFTGHGPSSKVSTTSRSARKSNCLKWSRPKPGPPVVSTTTVREMPSASGLAQVDFGSASAEDAAAVLDGRVPVISTSSLGASLLALAATRAGGGADSDGFAAALCAAALAGFGFDSQYHTPVIANAATTVANSKPNALRMVTFPKTRDTRGTDTTVFVPFH